MSNVTSIRPTHPAARDEIASAVNAFIARAGISKSATAREIGMSQSAFSRRTTGAEPFNADELGNLADFFGVTIIDLISGNVTQIAPNAKKAPPRRVRAGRSPSWTRTNNLPVNSRLLCQLSYRG